MDPTTEAEAVAAVVEAAVVTTVLTEIVVDTATTAAKSSADVSSDVSADVSAEAQVEALYDHTHRFVCAANFLMYQYGEMFRNYLNSAANSYHDIHKVFECNPTVAFMFTNAVQNVYCIAVTMPNAPPYAIMIQPIRRVYAVGQATPSRSSPSLQALPISKADPSDMEKFILFLYELITKHEKIFKFATVQFNKKIMLTHDELVRTASELVELGERICAHADTLPQETDSQQKEETPGTTA